MHSSDSEDRWRTRSIPGNMRRVRAADQNVETTHVHRPWWRRLTWKTWIIIAVAGVLLVSLLVSYAVAWSRGDLGRSYRDATTNYLTAALAHDSVAASSHVCQHVREEFGRDPTAADAALAAADAASGDLILFSLNRGDRSYASISYERADGSNTILHIPVVEESGDLVPCPGLDSPFGS
jgi:hypothetical protein